MELEPPAQVAASEVRLARLAFTTAAVAIPVNFVVFWQTISVPREQAGAWEGAFSAIALAQFVAGILAIVWTRKARKQGALMGTGTAWGGGFLALLAPVGWFFGVVVQGLGSMGGAWGRPLRVRGRQLHPTLRKGSTWTRGARPDPRGLDEATRAALEALWLHDAQKEHASVPAFSRVSWLLAAAGAPSELIERVHRAGIEEIEHTRACFALAAGYGGREHTVEPMPDLMFPSWAAGDDPRALLAAESLADGGLLEDYNADVAAACARGCEEPVTRAVLETIAREERGHAELSWELLAWLLDAHADVVRPVLVRERARLDAVRRPTAVSREVAPIAARADAAALRRHGRLPDAEWARLWDERLALTRQRLDALVAASSLACAASQAA